MNSTAGPDFMRLHRVRWVETDASGSVNLAGLLRMMEETEYAFLRSLGLSVVMKDERGTIGFPRISAELETRSPARFDDILEIRLFVVMNDGVTIRYRFEITGPGGEVASGIFSLACCRFPSDAPPRAILIPDFFQKSFPHASD
jgi:acyl-CoA thioester hydrolase